jgi:hypothetical protein
MRRCPKCGLEYDDDSRICRACGAILDEVDALAETTPFELNAATQSPWLPDDDEELPPAEPKVEPWLPDDDEIPLPAAAGDWICTTCGERVPATFDVCWNCATAERPLAAAPTSAAAPVQSPVEVPPKYPRRQCTACGSTRIIPSASIADTGQYSQGTLAVVVDADPQAFIFKNRRRGELLADICGDCGRVELRVHNHAELYEHYRSQP